MILNLAFIIFLSNSKIGERILLPVIFSPIDKHKNTLEAMGISIKGKIKYRT
jgi:hypothetical protein